MTERSAVRQAMGNFGAWCLSKLDEPLHRMLGPRKRALFADLPSRVLEIGPGLGANFRYYPAGTHVLALEPSPFMHEGLRRTADEFELELEILPSFAERLELPDESVDAVVGTLVLCSVRSPEQVMAQVLRVLTPGGRFYFLEHVAGRAGTLRRGVQHALAPPWRVMFDGCEPNRDTRAVIEATGFSEVDVEDYIAESVYYPINSQIVGRATK
ncbi:MAG: class I SAM-dependent methyltransferase [Polyangiaceae bacterium]